MLHLNALRPRRDGTLGSLSTWQDLSGNGHDVNLTSAVTFDGVNIPILTAYGEIPTWVFRQDYYVEIVTHPVLATKSQQVYALFEKSGRGVLALSYGHLSGVGNGSWILRTNGHTSANPYNGVYSHRLPQTTLHDTLYPFAVYYSTPLIYVNGRQVQTNPVFNNYDYPYSGSTTDYIINNRKIVCTPRLAALRVYSRELTYSELTHNYRMDKKRFHLP